MGSALAVGAIPYASNNNLIRNALAWLGVILILFSLIQFDPSTNFPGFAALVPCLGSALIIYANSNYTTVVGRLLSTYPMVWIGLISYSLYLWHWPLIAFMRLIWGGEQSLLDLPVIVRVDVSHCMAVLALCRETVSARKLGSLPGTGSSATAGIGAFAFLGMAILEGSTTGSPPAFHQPLW